MSLQTCETVTHHSDIATHAVCGPFDSRNGSEGLGRATAAASVRRRGFRSLMVAATGAVALLVGCADANPTEAPPPPQFNVQSSTSPTFSFGDGHVRVTVDSLTGMVSLTDHQSGRVVYSDLDSAMTAMLLDLGRAISVGDANYEVLANLNPFENAPPGYEPDFAPDHPESTYAGMAANGTVAGVATGSALIRRRPDQDAVSGTVGDLSLPGDATLASSTYDGPRCTMWATEIGQKRVAYHQGKGVTMQNFRDIAAIPEAQITWVNAKPTISIDDFRSFLTSAAVNVAATIHDGLTMDIMRAFYNGYNCQQFISVLVPTGQVVTGQIGGNGGSGGLTCFTYIEMWEISFDGGLTWWPLPIERQTCQPNVQ